MEEKRDEVLFLVRHFRDVASGRFGEEPHQPICIGVK